MLAAIWVVATTAIVCCASLSCLYLKALFNLYRVPLLHRATPVVPDKLPSLSVIVPACNEAPSVRPAVSTLLEQDYPDLQVILVDDRSTDGTGEVMDALAEDRSNVCVIHVERLPAGWLGKVHALEAGLSRARGDWVLFADAGVHFSAGVLRRAVALAEGEGYDHLSLGARTEGDAFWLRVATVAIGALFLSGIQPRRAASSDPDAAIGIGAFNLFRSTVFARTDGMAWLRMEVADDMALARLLKRAGARSCFAFAPRDLSLSWYGSLGAMFRGLEKNFFAAAAHYDYLRMCVGVLGLSLTAGSPVMALAVPVPYFWLTGVVTYAVVSCTVLAMGLRLGTPVLAGLLAIPAGQVIVAAMLLNAALQCRRRGGVVWRGTLYPLAELRSGQRIKM